MSTNLAFYSKLTRAKAIYAEIIESETSLVGVREVMLTRAWSLGKILTELKEEIGHGKWLLWLEGNWPELGERNAQRCMGLFRANEQAGDRLKNVDSSDLSVESVRKFMWGYIPAKERPQLAGDAEIKPGTHHLTFINHFSKYDRQLKNGHVNGFDLETFQREVEPMFRRLVDICGRAWIYSILNSP